jgi:predicted DNA-binding transcriptional regulator YafY
MDGVRADRLLAVLLLLQRHRKLPAAELAERLEVSTRTIYRDVEALSAAGVPVYAERGRNGGVSLVPGYRSDLTGLSAREAQALFLFSGQTPAEQLGRQEDLRQAIRKLLAAVPASQRDEVERISGRVIVDPDSWRRGRDRVPHLSGLQDAVLHDRRLRMRYPSRTAGRVREYHIDPYGLVAKAGVWYLLAGTAEGVRTFRVSRVQELAPGDGTFTRPVGLDVEALWARSRQGFDERRPAPCPVVVRVDKAAVPIVSRVAEAFLTGAIGPAPRGDADRRAVARMVFSGPEHAVVSLLPFAAQVEVVAPAEVRHLLARRAADTAVLYEGESAGSSDT